MSKTNPAGRVVLFDEVRGLCLILMVFYHGMLDLVTSGVDLTWFFSSVMQRFLQPAVAGTFIFISGAVSRYSRSNLRRAAAPISARVSNTWTGRPSMICCCLSIVKSLLYRCYSSRTPR